MIYHQAINAAEGGDGLLDQFTSGCRGIQLLRKGLAHCLAATFRG